MGLVNDLPLILGLLKGLHMQRLSGSDDEISVELGSYEEVEGIVMAYWRFRAETGRVIAAISNSRITHAKMRELFPTPAQLAKEALKAKLQEGQD